MARRSTKKAPSSSSNEDALDTLGGSTLEQRRGADAPLNTSKKPIFDEAASSSDDDSEDGGAHIADESTALKINEEYARRFEHNKKREERQKLEEKYGPVQSNGKEAGSNSDSESSEDETEDEEAFLLTEELNAQMSAALEAIKKKDPRIYDTDSTFYKAPEAVDQETAKEDKKEKPVFLRDYHRERYMAGDTGADEEDDQKPQTYAQEQDAVKQSLLAEINAAAEGASGSASEDDGFIKRKKAKGTEALGENNVHPSRTTKVQLTELDVKNADQDPELYLSNFMASKSWVAGSKWEAFDSDDDEADDKADEFEAAYNMRFENPERSNEILKSYSRSITAARSVRREEKTGRQRLRELEKEKKEAEKRERHEARARLRKIKVDEAEEKLNKIRKAAGLTGKQVKDDELMKLLDDAWENDKWEEEMSRRFGDNYYAEADTEMGGSDKDEPDAFSSKKKPKKPKWDDDIDIKDLVPDFVDEPEKPNVTLSDAEPDQDQASDEEDEEDRPSKKRKTGKDHKKDRADAKRAARQERAKIEALVDARLELDAPSALAGSSTSASATAATLGPFRYRETSPNSFGLTARDILLAPSDAALNEFAGIKKLATWRDAEKKRKDKKKLGKKARLRQWRRENFGEGFEETGPTFGFADIAAGGPEGEVDEGKGKGKDEGGKKKRKRSKGKKAAKA